MRHVLLDAVALHHRDADDEHGDAEMREDHAVPRRRVGRRAWRRSPSCGACRKRWMMSVTVAPTIHNARNRPTAISGDQRADHERQQHRGDDGDAQRPAQPRPQVRQLRACASSRSGPTPIRNASGAISGDEHGVEVRRPDRDLADAERVEEQRIQRAEQHARARDDEQDVVGEQQRLARHRRESPRRRRPRPRAPRTARASRRRRSRGTPG